MIKGQATEIIDIAHFLPLAFEDWLRLEGARGRRRRRARVLLVDDAAFFRNMLAPVLKAAGYAVTPAASAPEALALLQRGRRFDVIITDIEMPGHGRLRARLGDARAIRAPPQLPIIGLSSLVSAEAIERGTRRSASTTTSPSSTARA